MSTENRKPSLIVEVLLKATPPGEDPQTRKLQAQQELQQWLPANYTSLLINQYIPVPEEGTFPCAAFVQTISVFDCPTSPDGLASHDLAKVKLVIHAYELHPVADPAPPLGHCNRQDTDALQEKLIDLPNESLAETWDSLVFESVNPTQILRSIAQIITLMKEPSIHLDPSSLSRLILLHGPPGCGKTTLCRALAQKLSIHLSPLFPATHLQELNTQTLLSKFYSETGRLISSTFTRLSQRALSHPTTLHCILMDEIESIASSRARLASTNECLDSVRGTNQLLTALDGVQRLCPNVVVLCTSNLKGAIDGAFVDRVGYEVCVPPPCESAVYGILRGALNGLVRAGVVAEEAYEYPDEADMLFADQLAKAYVPEWEKLLLLDGAPKSPGKVLAGIAADCKGFSGRKLRKLPLLAITQYTWGRDCALEDALAALKRAVADELACAKT